MRCRVRVASVSADQAIDHEFKNARCLVPIHGRDDHDSLGGDPPRVNLAHPVRHLTQTVIGIARTRPVTQRHGGRNAGLTRIDDLAVLGSECTQIEQVDLDLGALEDVGSQLCQAKTLRHLARTCFVIAGGAADEQYPERCILPVVSDLRCLDLGPSIQPVRRQVVGWIGKLRSCRSGEGGFAARNISLPGDLQELVDMGGLDGERRIFEPRPKPSRELLLRDRPRPLSGSYLRSFGSLAQ